MLSTGDEIKLDNLKEAFYGKVVKQKKDVSLIELASLHLQYFESHIGSLNSKGSLKNYKTTFKYLLEFIPFEFNHADVSVKLVDHSFCEKYYTLLLKQKSCNTNGAYKQIQRLKTIINYGIKNGIASENKRILFLSNSFHTEGYLFQWMN